MKYIPEWANWVAEDKGGDLWVYDNKPEKDEDWWDDLTEDGQHKEITGELKESFNDVKWTDKEPTKITKKLDLGTINKPKHYQNKDGKGLFQKWYEQHDLETYRHIMRAIAERYISRYENKNGLEDLEKGIYTLQRLKEVEQADKESDFERVGKLIETYHAGTNPND